MIKKEIGYSYNDLTIIPAVVSTVSSRSKVFPFDGNGMLPIFTAPMSTVVSKENLSHWNRNRIYPIIPRNIDYDTRVSNMHIGNWVAFSLKEVEELFLNDDAPLIILNEVNICVDIANGHMLKLIETCKSIKKKYGNHVLIMTGNIANPETIHAYEYAGIDYVRLSIGSGAGCLTSPQTSVHYPIASLIDECHKIKQENHYKIKLIADGGIRNYGDVIKALALGADYVMVGSVLASLFESAAECTSFESINTKFSNDLTEETKRDILTNHTIEKVFYGMSTKKAQKLIKPDGENLKTSEGVEKILKCTHTIKQWSENMEAYLRSAMSYCDIYNLPSFIGGPTLIVNSSSEINAVNK